MDGVVVVEDGVGADSFLEYEGCVVEGFEEGCDWEGVVVFVVAACGGFGNGVATHELRGVELESFQRASYDILWSSIITGIE